MKKTLTKTLLSSALLLTTAGVNAAAFQLAEISTSGLGRAYAGEAAIADNASVVATNPAGMSLFQRPEISVGAIYVDPHIDVEGTTQAWSNTSGLTSVDASHKNIASNSIVPNLYAIYPINEKFSVGGGMNVNYGLSTEYNKGYSAGFLAGNTELKAFNFNLSGAYRITEHLSAGLGFNAVYADAKIERFAGTLPGPAMYAATYRAALARMGSAAASTAAGQAAAQSAAVAAANNAAAISSDTLLRKIEGNEWGFGWNAGLMYEVNKNNRFGLAYHSRVDIDFDGQYSDAGSAILGALAQGNQPGSLTLPLPAYWEFSGYHKVTDKLALHYSYKYTQWDKFTELRATGRSGNELFQKDEKFRNSSRIALGATYDINEKLTMRAGIAFDESAAQDHHSLSIPDTDRTWYSLGATYRFTPDLSVDLGYAYLHGSKVSFTETQSGLVSRFTSKAHANLYGLNLNYRF
ncbi:MAG: outer membrane protein transport protein [Pasteurellaceae bacterium]|nr:outer membrane protein transport protein [Pasteurellaceae bacterium]